MFVKNEAENIENMANFVKKLARNQQIVYN